MSKVITNPIQRIEQVEAFKPPQDHPQLVKAREEIEAKVKGKIYHYVGPGTHTYDGWKVTTRLGEYFVLVDDGSS